MASSVFMSALTAVDHAAISLMFGVSVGDAAGAGAAGEDSAGAGGVAMAVAFRSS
jgi:hypothetical protein